MEFESNQNNVVAKIPLLKQSDYDTWKIKIEQFFQIQDYALWEVIEYGNSFKPTTKIQKKIDVKARSMLLMALPNEHLLTFSQYKDAKTLFEAIQARFGGNEATKKTQKILLKQMYENFNASSQESLDTIFNRFQKLVSQLALLGENISQEDLNMKFLRSLPTEWNTHTVVWRNKPDIGMMNIDELYNNFKIVEQEVKRSGASSSDSSIQNAAFVSTPNNSNDAKPISVQGLTNPKLNASIVTSWGILLENAKGQDIKITDQEAKTSGSKVKKAQRRLNSNDVKPASVQVNTGSTSIGTVSTNAANISDATVYAFLAHQPNGSQVVYEDLQQIHDDDLEEMDLKWNMALISMRARKFYHRIGRKLVIDGGDTTGFDKSKIECFNCNKLGHFARECIGPRHQDNRSRSQDFRNKSQESSKKTVIVEETSPTAMIAFDGGGFDWSYMTEEEAPTNMALMAFSDSELNKSNFDLANYKRGLASVEEQLVFYKKNEVAFCDQIAVLKRDATFKDSEIDALKTLVEKLKKEKEGIKIKVDGFENASKKLDTLVSSQISINNNKGIGFDKYNAIASPPTGMFAPPTVDLSNSLRLNNIVPSKGLTCLIAKATTDESNMWHRRLGHINFKTMNKLLKDDYSRFSWVFFLAKKDETSAVLKNFITGIENQLNHKVKAIRCDNGTEFKNFEMNQFCGIKGIKMEFSNARTPQQNEVVERKNRTLIEAAKTMVLVTKPHNKTPYELLLGRPPTVSFMRPFRCPVTILNTLDHLGKFDGKADEGLLVGYSINSKAFRVYNSRTRKVEENLHVNFLENKENVAGSGPEWKQVLPEDHDEGFVAFAGSTKGGKITGKGKIKTEHLDFEDVYFVKELKFNLFSVSQCDRKNSVLFTETECLILSPEFKLPINSATRIDEEDDSSSKSDAELNNAAKNQALASKANNSGEDTHVNGTNPAKDDYWLAQENEDYNSYRNTLHPGGNSYDDDISLTRSRNGKSEDIKYNCRKQRLQWAHTAVQTKEDEINIMKLFLSQIEPKKVNQALDEESWVEAMQEELLQFKLLDVWTVVDLPYGKKAIGSKWVLTHTHKKDQEVSGFVDPAHPNKVYKVKKALYGLHQAPRAWYETLSTYLLENGYRRGSIDKTLFIKKIKDDILLIQVYVDDIIFGSTKESLSTEFEQLMHKKFQMSSMRKLTFVFGLQVEQRTNGIFLSQDKYVKEILKKFGYGKDDKVKIPDQDYILLPLLHINSHVFSSDEENDSSSKSDAGLNNAAKNQASEANNLGKDNSGCSSNSSLPNENQEGQNEQRNNYWLAQENEDYNSYRITTPVNVAGPPNAVDSYISDLEDTLNL
ncbi:putative ribonuclease H-like domain-containing protein [Tanacetum coccineum]